MFRLLTFVLSFLLIFAFTSALVGNPAPKFEVALQMLQKIDIDTESLISSFYFQSTYADQHQTEITDDMAWYEILGVYVSNAFWSVVNFFANIFNVISGIVSFIGELLLALASLLKILIYLMFGATFESVTTTI